VPVVCFSLDSESYDKLKAEAEKRGASVGGLAKSLVKELVKGGEVARPAPGLEGMLENIVAKISELERRLNTLEAERAARQVQAAESGKKVFCKNRGEIGNLEKYVKTLEKSGKLADWWEEADGKVCFEVKA